jgi:Meiotically up-regulated gene 113
MSAVVSKASIVDEIRRTTLENGGTPLGLARFQTETGIRKSEILGVHWARWGDALGEAGYSPNQLKQAYSNQDLIRYYANLAAELGRLPVKDEVKIKHRSDPSFPGWDPFRRLGSRSERLRAVAEFCGNNAGYEVVLKCCEEYTAVTNVGQTTNQVSPTEGSLGSVYLAKSGRYYKIGKSNAAGRREYELSLQLPEKLKMIHVITTDDPTGIEAYWHKRFDSKRKNGEWFDLSAVEVAAFKLRRKFM